MKRVLGTFRASALFLVVVLVPFLSFTIPAQDPPDFTTYAAYFKVDQDFETILTLRNKHWQLPVRVTPVLYSDAGSVLRLPEVEIAANAVKRVSLGPLIQAHPRGAAFRFGAVALEYIGPGTLQAMAAVRNIPLRLIFSFPFRRGYANGESRVYDSNWWLRDEETDGRLVLFNSSDTPITVQMKVANRALVELGSISLVPKQFREVRFRRLLLAAGVRGFDMGSLTLTHDGPAHALVPGLFFSNEQTGFSITSPFAARRTDADSQERTTLNVPNVLMNQPDPAIGFPADHHFTPYALFSNLTDSFLPVDLLASYDSGGQVTQVSLPGVRLAPGETRLVDLSAANLIPAQVGSLALKVSHAGPATAMVSRIFSLDHTGDCVFVAEMMPGASNQFDAMIWDAGYHYSSLISIFNTGEDAANVRVTLLYNDGQGSYKLPLLSIPAGVTRTVFVKPIVQSGQPDENGNVIPPGVTFGSAKIRAEGEAALQTRLAVIAAAFDPVRGLCSEYLGSCPYVTSVTASPSSMQGFVGQQIALYLNITYDSEPPQQTAPNLSGYNPAVVNTSWNFVSLVGPGSTQVWCSVQLPTPQGGPTDPFTQIPDEWSTCYYEPYGDNVSFTVQALPPSVSITSFSPNPILLGGTASAQVSVNPSAPVTLTISTSGTGRAKFVSTNSTTMQISQTTAVSIRGDVASTGGALDLRLNVTQGSALLAAADFSVTTGACTAGHLGATGGGLKSCPAQVQLRERWNITNYNSACQFSCAASGHDGTFTPSGTCLSVFSGIQGSSNQTLESTLNGDFSATDCNWHHVQIRTTIRNAAGVPTDYTTGGIGLKCTSLPNGSSCP